MVLSHWADTEPSQETYFWRFKMKMVKSLLLGSAAGLVAVAGAQAADLPVKAKPVQYVKICSLYGVGFYYIPGTDMCIKIGGWVRAEAAWGVNGSSTNVQNGDVNNRNTNNNWWRIRGYITADARDQTEYGTVRGYLAVGLSTNTNGLDNAGNQFDANRAFIQWAGFTFGRAQSFFDFYSQAALG
ncbi:MAG: porin, partial [Pseudolabrys sp.]